MDTLKITWSMQGEGIEGIDDDPKNSLSNALNSILESGKPFKRLSQCFCRDIDTSILYWLGVFIHSAGDKVLFFPGFNTKQTSIQLYQGKNLRWNQQFLCNHFSLEKDFSRWHVTSPRSKEHLGSINTLSLGNSRYLWFGLSIQDYSVLSAVKKETIVTSKVPPFDGKRRMDIITQAREGAVFHIVEMHPNYKTCYTEGFLHFTFILGPNNFPTYNGSDLCFPEGSPFLSKPFSSDLTRIPIRTHRISLSSQIDIQITSSWLPGSLTTPISITSQSAPIS